MRNYVCYGGCSVFLLRQCPFGAAERKGYQSICSVSGRNLVVVVFCVVYFQSVKSVCVTFDDSGLLGGYGIGRLEQQNLLIYSTRCVHPCYAA